MRRAVAPVLGLLAHAVFGATIRVSPDAGYQPIEAAQPGDEVVLAPGTYRFRLALTVSGTPSNPIVIRGEDPTQPPLFDYSGADLQSFPGSNAGSHPGRGAWDVIGSDLEFRSIAFRGAVTVGPTAADLPVPEVSPPPRGCRTRPRPGPSRSFASTTHRARTRGVAVGTRLAHLM